MQKTLLTLALAGVAASAAHAQAFAFKSKFEFAGGGGEVVSYTNGILAVTDSSSAGIVSGNGVSLFNIDNAWQFTNQQTIDFGASIGGMTIAGINSVAIDSRGFGVAALENATDAGLGKIGIFDTTNGSVLGSFDVGVLPDMVTISGNRILVANEGEWLNTRVGDLDPTGSVSVFEFNGSATDANGVFSSISSKGSIAPNFTDLQITNSGARLHDTSYSANEAYRNLEPEYITVEGDLAFVTFQENNAVGVLDLAQVTPTWIRIDGLGTHDLTADTSENDNTAIQNDIKGLVMPDAIASFQANGKTYVVMGSEGDARHDDGDLGYFKDGDLGAEFTGFEIGANPDGLATSGTADDSIRDLEMPISEADPDGNGLVNDIVSLSDRSPAHIYEVNTATGELTFIAKVEDSEAFLAAQDPTRHNANDGGDPGEYDKRSENKGAEWEAIADVIIDGTQYVVAGAERQGGLVLIDVSDVNNPTIVDYINGDVDGLNEPEVITTAIINGSEVAIVGFEGGNGGIGIYAIPEPAAFTGVLGLAGLLLALRRRA